MRYGASEVWHLPCPLINSFNKTEASFHMQAILSEGFYFYPNRRYLGETLYTLLFFSPQDLLSFKREQNNTKLSDNERVEIYNILIHIARTTHS